MRATLIITDDSGNNWHYELPLTDHTTISNVNRGSTKKRVKEAAPASRQLEHGAKESQLDFALPVRPFIKRYARELAGAKKFTLLVAHLASGDVNAEIPRAEIEKQWNKMTALMGGTFNAAHSSRAKDNGWIDSPKHGVYKLLPGWKSVLTNG